MEDFKRAMRAFPATVSIITANDGRRHHGMTVTSVTSLSMDPPSLLMCLNQLALIHDIMLESRYFNVNVLRVGQQEMANDFAGRLPHEERFKNVQWGFDDSNVPILKDAHSVLSCRKSAALPFGTHTIIVGVVERVLLDSECQPLMYHEGSYSVAQALGLSA